MIKKAGKIAAYGISYTSDLFILQQVTFVFALVSIFSILQNNDNQIDIRFFSELLFVQIFTNIGNSRERSLQIGALRKEELICHHIIRRLIVISSVGLLYFYFSKSLNLSSIIVILFTINSMISISFISFRQVNSSDFKSAAIILSLSAVSVTSYSTKYFFANIDMYILFIQFCIFMMIYVKMNLIIFNTINIKKLINFPKDSITRLSLWIIFITVSEYDRYIIALREDAEEGLIFGSATILLSLISVLWYSLLPRIYKTISFDKIKMYLVFSSILELVLISLIYRFVHDDYQGLFIASGIKIALNILTLPIYYELILADSNKCIFVNILTAVFVFFSSVLLYFGFFDFAAAVRLLSGFVGVLGLFYARRTI